MEPIDLAVRLIKESSSLVALTGAGISTDSGIPDFRSPDGIWNRYPALLGDYSTFQKHPEKFLELGKELLPVLMSAQPNKGHTALRDLEGMGYIKAVITQNIDGLHQAAGTQKVIEIHGTYKTATCTRCYRKFSIDEMLSLLRGIPLCPDCSSIVKPDVVMFGEQLPREAFLEAKKLAEDADVMIVAGSSLEVYPASHLVLVTKGNHGRIIIINDTKTALDRVADVVIRDNLSVQLPRIVEKCKEERL
ncbi:MAG: NAD-dependent deacylase [Theionarchaea archaeon]|nr:NAD-dependent deacylase [Theionarchaea archaeon]